MWTAFLGAALLGLVTAGLVALLDLGLTRYRPQEARPRPTTPADLG